MKKKLELTDKQFDLIVWCIDALKEQHIKLLLQEGELGTRDWVTKKSDLARKALGLAVLKTPPNRRKHYANRTNERSTK